VQVCAMAGSSVTHATGCMYDAEDDCELAQAQSLHSLYDICD